jgi:hypothetical protein
MLPVFLVTGLTSNSKKAVLKATALEVIFELPDNVMPLGPSRCSSRILPLGNALRKGIPFYCSHKRADAMDFALTVNSLIYQENQ